MALGWKQSQPATLFSSIAPASPSHSKLVYQHHFSFIWDPLESVLRNGISRIDPL